MNVHEGPSGMLGWVKLDWLNVLHALDIEQEGRGGQSFLCISVLMIQYSMSQAESDVVSMSTLIIIINH